ncbi:PREDICTED: rho GTPase-activating protein gacN-like isoform X2 [Ceratosolen solmsi marchali]|uniref:Rho GTPase-activating protein gacN-like isoform X2 n=1 Tax=Ceratosolen solmsi marchali TaxID=326594 RepID=A0AAJ6YDQ9_9HYME|nr:PREDICTED: rho GTPase-activating protein gacN-like isoform X2 [Ceratosolen solmsi marchali]
MLIYDVLHKEKVYQVVSRNLRSLGVKYRIKKNVKTDKPNRDSALKKVFRTPLSYLPLDVVNLSSGAIIHIPVFVCQAATFLLQNVYQEGLFRKAGSQLRQKEIISRLDGGGNLGEKNNAIDVANCLKTFLRNLPEPLIPFVYHDLFIRCNMLKMNKINALLLACILLPPHHLNTLAYLMEFLKTVASYEKQNKMGIDNLARVMGPNIMPLQETTMLAVQSRLEAHLTIVKLLIENAEKIGILPNDISEFISMDNVGSIDIELNRSDPWASFKSKKKKHRSGSLTRMLSGLKKIVGKNNSPNEVDGSENLLAIETACHLYTPSVKASKKRKVQDNTDLLNIKRQKICDKIEKPKKLRLSLDRFVPKPKQKMNTQNIEICKTSFSPCMERRWSSSNNSFDSKKRGRSKSIDSPLSSPQIKIRNSIQDKTLEEVFIDANINLSDDCSEQISQKKSSSENKVKCKRFSSTRKSMHSYSLRRSSSNISVNSKTVIHNPEEYVQIPKSEYEEIKHRVSAIESRISQEFKNITSESVNMLTVNPITIVQSQYEKTLEESNIENIASTDQLAKRLSKELKIRKSTEHKIIRSPSARKIGSLRRRSQEKPIRKIHRTISWHAADKLDVRNSVLKSDQRLNNYCPKQCNLKRSKPLVKRDSYKNIEQIPKLETRHSAPFCSEATNARLNYLQEQLNTLINHTAEHTRDSLSNEDFGFLDDDVFQSIELSPMSSRQNALNPVAVRRASSFHSCEFIDNSQYFNNKIKELRKTNSQQNLTFNYSESIDISRKMSESRKEKTVSWKDADIYFQQEAKLLTPVPQTGRASVAKLRTQNAGMVLAKAKLFDDPSKESIDFSRRKSVRVQMTAPTSEKEGFRTPHGTKKHNNEIIVRRKHDKNRRTPNTSPLLKIEKDNQLVQSIISNDVYKINENSICKTPHIKKPLNVKTPRSVKSLSARKSILNSRRTPMKAVLPITPKRQSPRIVLKSTQLNRHIH